jgi:hypothetical protein
MSRPTCYLNADKFKILYKINIHLYLDITYIFGYHSIAVCNTIAYSTSNEATSGWCNRMKAQPKAIFQKMEGA